MIQYYSNIESDQDTRSKNLVNNFWSSLLDFDFILFFFLLFLVRVHDHLVVLLIGTEYCVPNGKECAEVAHVSWVVVVVITRLSAHNWIQCHIVTEQNLNRFWKHEARVTVQRLRNSQIHPNYKGCIMNLIPTVKVRNEPYAGLRYHPVGKNVLQRMHIDESNGECLCKLMMHLVKCLVEWQVRPLGMEQSVEKVEIQVVHDCKQEELLNTFGHTWKIVAIEWDDDFPVCDEICHSQITQTVHHLHIEEAKTDSFIQLLLEKWVSVPRPWFALVKFVLINDR